jgi:F-type H+-transporting ATPase subunit delta
MGNVTGQDSTVEGVPGRYATALFQLARDGDALDAVTADLDNFHAMLDESDDLARLVRSPVYTADEQNRAVTAVLGKAGITGLAANFIGLVAKNHRLFAIGDMIKAYRKLLAGHRGEVTAEVSSAETLSDTQIDALKQALKETVGRDVQLDTKVDPALLGGLIVKVGSRMVDNSLRTKLNNLKIAMKEVG